MMEKDQRERLTKELKQAFELKRAGISACVVRALGRFRAFIVTLFRVWFLFVYVGRSFPAWVLFLCWVVVIFWW